MSSENHAPRVPRVHGPWRLLDAGSGALLFGLLLACNGKAPEAAENVDVAPPTAEAATEADETRSALDPESACNHSVCGTVTDQAGTALENATLQVLRSDGKTEEPEPLEQGGFLFHIREENSGPPPWKLTFAAEGYEPQTVDVPTPLPEAGQSYAIKLQKSE